MIFFSFLETLEHSQFGHLFLSYCKKILYNYILTTYIHIDNLSMSIIHRI